MPIFEMDEELAKRIRRMVKKFPDNFNHIDPKRVLAISSDKESRSTIADVRRVQAQLHCVLPYRVVMTKYSNLYDGLDEDTKDLVVVHELEHIAEDENDDENYRLRRHTVEDWSEMVGILGPHWSKTKRSFKIKDLEDTNWKTGIARATLKKAGASQSTIDNALGQTGRKKKLKKKVRK